LGVGITRHGKELGGNNFSQDHSGQHQVFPRIPFVSTLTANISSHFGSQYVVSAFSIFDPKKTPKLDCSEYSNYGKDSVSILLH